MNRCEETRELIPWYVEGNLSPEEGAAVAGHLASCSDCLRDVAAAIHLRSTVREALSLEPGMSEAVWESVSRQAVGRRVTHLDIGSFLVGLRLGAWITRRGTPVRADLRLLGREVPLVNRHGKGGSS